MKRSVNITWAELKVGLVVTPLKMPQLAASRISLMLAVSRYSCMTHHSFE